MSAKYFINYRNIENDNNNTAWVNKWGGHGRWALAKWQEADRTEGMRLTGLGAL